MAKKKEVEIIPNNGCDALMKNTMNKIKQTKKKKLFHFLSVIVAASYK